MFEEICLTCGKHLTDDGRVYCSDECQNLDAASPSISSASSTFSSPHLGYAVGGDVPPLVPSALGTALKDHRSRDRQSVSSSSASSTSWSVLTDEDEDDAQYINSDYGYLDSADPGFEGSSKPILANGCLASLRPAPLSYARRPSGTNNGSSVLHRRTSSGSFSGHVHGAPRSAPIRFSSHSSTEDDELYSDFGSSSRDESEPSSPQTVPDNNEQRKSTITKAKRSRNRASLPAYFSLLQLNNDTLPVDVQARASPSVSTCSTQVARASPPTPKLTIAGMPHHISTSQPIVAMQVTPPSRKRDLEGSARSYRVFDDSSSSSRSRSRSQRPFASEVEASRSRLDSRGSKGSKGSVEQVFDWSSVYGLPRGRTTVRRNSSPPPKMMLSRMALEEFSAANVNGSRRADFSDSRSRQRGRIRAEDLDGIGGTRQAPGYGHGRSGLLDRERALTQRDSSRPAFLL